MWNKALIACARTYPSGVLTVVEDSGYPRSVRCLVEFDDARELILISIPSLEVVSRQGLACLLFHRHNADMSGQRELLLQGDCLKVTVELLAQLPEWQGGEAIDLGER